METLNMIAGGMCVVDAYAGSTCKVAEGPTPQDLIDPSFLEFLSGVLKDALGDDYEEVA